MSNKQMSDACVLECSELGQRAEVLARGSRAERQEAAVLLARIANLRDAGLSSSEIEQRYAEVKSTKLARELGKPVGKPSPLTAEESRAIRPLFEEYLRSPEVTASDYEQRASVLLGRPTSQTYSGTSGAQGAVTVPLEFSKNFFLGLAQYSPLMDEANVTLEISDSYALRSSPAAMWDLSGFAAVRVGGSGYGDAVQQTAQTVPVAAESFLQGFIYKATLDAALELFTDDPSLTERVAQAYSIGFGRGIGTDLAVGSGVGEVPQGLLTGAVSSGLSLGTGAVMTGSSQASGNITAEDLLGVYFAVNRIYRASSKCAWVMSDRAYQRVRNSVDNNGRPLIHISDDGEVLLGKKVLVDPNIPDGYGSSPHVAGSVVFGDLSYFRVRCSQLSISKTIQVGGGIEKGIFKLIGRQRASSMVCDPTNGVNPPIVSAVLV